MASLGTIARRTFLIGAAAIAGGVAVGYYYYRRPYPNPLEGELADGEATFNPYVKIADDNTITVVAPRAEMGQGISTSLAALVAEELDVDLAQVRVEHGSNIALLWPISDEAVAFVEEHVAPEAQTWGSALVVEQRYLDDLVAGMHAEGLVGREVA